MFDIFYIQIPRYKAILSQKISFVFQTLLHSTEQNFWYKVEDKEHESFKTVLNVALDTTNNLLGNHKCKFKSTDFILLFTSLYYWRKKTFTMMHACHEVTLAIISRFKTMGHELTRYLISRLPLWQWSLPRVCETFDCWIGSGMGTPLLCLSDCRFSVS